MFENELETLPGGKYFGTYLLGQAIKPDMPIVMFPDILRLYIMDDQDSLLVVVHWLFEAAAAGGNFLIPYNAYTFGGGSLNVVPEDVGPYIKFLREHSSYFRDVSRLAKVGVLYDYSSALFDYIDRGFKTPYTANEKTHLGFLGLSLALQEAHIPFDVVYAGDGELIDKVPSPGELEKYSTIILPGSSRINEEVRNTLDQYKERGGKILDVHDLPYNYWLKREGIIRNEIVEKVRGVDGNTYIETDASENVGIVLYKKENSLIIHVVNYDYSYSKHDFNPTKDIHINIDLKEFDNIYDKSLTLRSHNSYDTELNYEIKDKRLYFVLPELDLYCLIIFE